MRRAQPSEVDAERCRALLDAYLSPRGMDDIYLQSIKKAETLDTLGFTRRVWEQREEPRRPATSAAAFVPSLAAVARCRRLRKLLRRTRLSNYLAAAAARINLAASALQLERQWPAGRRRKRSSSASG